MHDDACRLVDDEQVLVLVSDSKRDLLGLEGLLRKGFELDRLAALEAVALRAGATV
jgi:hypothetical protein